MRDPISMQWQPYAASGSLPTAADGMPPVCQNVAGESLIPQARAEA